MKDTISLTEIVCRSEEVIPIQLKVYVFSRIDELWLKTEAYIYRLHPE